MCEAKSSRAVLDIKQEVFTHTNLPSATLLPSCTLLPLTLLLTLSSSHPPSLHLPSSTHAPLSSYSTTRHTGLRRCVVCPLASGQGQRHYASSSKVHHLSMPCEVMWSHVRSCDHVIVSVYTFDSQITFCCRMPLLWWTVFLEGWKQQNSFLFQKVCCEYVWVWYVCVCVGVGVCMCACVCMCA